MPIEESGFKVYSLGIVTVAKVRGDDYIYVDPIEHLSQDKGNLNEVKRDKNAAVPDARGVKKSGSVKGGSSIIAKWIGGDDSNRQTPPDVQPGETVRIYSFADTNDYYWGTHFREPGIRRLETVRHSYCNIPSGTAAFGDDTSYWLEWSTHDKMVHLHTSSNDGEPVSFDIVINAKEGSITIKDDIANSLVMDSAAGRLSAIMNNAIILKAGGSVEIETEDFKVTAGSSTIKAGTHTEDAAVTITNGLSVSAGSGTGGAAIALEGDIKMNGNMTGTGNIKTDGSVHGSNI